MCCIAFPFLMRCSRSGICSGGKTNERATGEREVLGSWEGCDATAQDAVSGVAGSRGAGSVHGAGGWFLDAEGAGGLPLQGESLCGAGGGNRRRSKTFRGSLREVSWRGRAGTTETS